MGTHDKDSAARFAACRADAERRLRSQMEALGLHARDGWKIAEVTREARDGTELVLRPLHLRLDAPKGLECSIWIHEDDGSVDSSFAPSDGG